MKVIITGAGGLLGRRVTLEARRAGFETVCIGRAARPPAGLACDQWLARDLMDPQLLEYNWADCAGAPVIHLAAETRIYEPGLDFTRDNIASTKVVCRLAAMTGGRLVFLSSAAVYSGLRTRRPIAALLESDETKPSTAYGRSKLAAEQVIAAAGVDGVVLRVFGVLSERLLEVPDRGNLVQAIVRAWQTDAEVVIATDESGLPLVRDYVGEEDVGRCVVAALGWPSSGGTPITVNLCTGTGTDTLAMVEMAQAVTGRSIRVRRVMQQSPVNPVMVGDPARLRTQLGWVPACRVREFWSLIKPDPAPVPGSF